MFDPEQTHADPDQTRVSPDQSKLIDEFAQALKAGENPNPEDYLTGADSASRTETLREMVGLDMQVRWKQWLSQRDPDTVTRVSETGILSGESAPLLETFLQEYPLLQQTNHLKWLVDKEIEIRTECGDAIGAEEYHTRFPELQFNDTSLTGLRTVAQTTPPRSGSSWLSPPPELDLNRPFGPYELLDKIGAGGMGLVYKARQISADRIVALKILRLDRLHGSAASQGFLDRFQTEARATSRIDHPGIVTVFDVGEVDGLPYYAMKFVDGENLAEIQSRRALDQREAARIIADSARALQAAHNCGVLHRDLKPQNILIDRESGQACLADFGLAKLIEADQSQTREGDILGTPGYMSPEQAKDSGSVSTLADVYGLGASLYFLLSGQAPFTGDTALQILRRVIDEPVKPPASVAPSVDSDLELICLKAIDKEPGRRYPSAAALADDLERWLNGEPIEARPAGKLERMYRWCRRNPFSASLIAVAVCSLIMTAVVSVLGYREVSRALAESEESYRQAKETVNDFFTTVSEDVLLQQPAMHPLRRELLEKALHYYRGFLERRGQDGSLQQEIAETFYRIGRIQELIQDCESAQESYQRAEQLQRKLLSQPPADRKLRMALSQTLTARAGCFSRQDDPAAALAAVEEALSLRKSLVESDPQDLEAVRLLANAEMNLAILHGRQRDVELARKEFEMSLERRQPYLEQKSPAQDELLRDQGMCYYNLANLEIDDGQTDKAGPAVSEAIRIFERCLKSAAEPFQIRQRLGLAYRLRGELWFAEFDSDKALADYNRSAQILSQLAKENPLVLPLQQASGEVELLRGEVYFEEGNLQGSLSHVTQSIEELSKLPDDMPDARISLIRALHARAAVYAELRDLQASRTDLERSITLIEAIPPGGPDADFLRAQLKSAKELLKGLPAADSTPLEL